MTVSVRDAGPFEKVVSFTVPDDELDAAKTKAARRLSREVKIHGFRPGKAPRPIVERTVGSETLRQEAIEELLPEKVTSVLEEVELDPAVSPQLVDMEDGEDGLQVEVKVTLWPTLEEIPEHHGRTVEVGSPEISDEELEEQLARIRDQYAELEVVDRPAAEGDYVTIDISASHEGEEIPEASASDLLYEVGSGGFIEGADEAVVGLSAGESADFQGTLPAGFGERAGEEVTFHIAVTQVQAKRLPDLTDEWVDDSTEFETVEELRSSLAEQMMQMKKRSLSNQFREQALEQLVAEVDIDLPDALIRTEMDEILHRFAHRLESQGISLEDYFRATGLDQDQFVEDLRNQAEHSLRTRVLLEAVADQDGLEVSDSELDAVIQGVAAQSEDPEAVLRALQEEGRDKSLVADILRNKALEAIVTAATPVDEEGNPVDLTVEAPETTQVVEGEVVEGEVVADAAGTDVPAGQVVTADVVEASEEE